MAINRHVKIDSSSIASLGYDPGSRVLEVIFATDTEAVYRYQNVDCEVFAELLNAESVGSFFAKSIRPNKKLYPYEKVIRPDRDKLVGTESLRKSIKKER